MFIALLKSGGYPPNVTEKVQPVVGIQEKFWCGFQWNMLHTKILKAWELCVLGVHMTHDASDMNVCYTIWTEEHLYFVHTSDFCLPVPWNIQWLVCVCVYLSRQHCNYTYQVDLNMAERLLKGKSVRQYKGPSLDISNKNNTGNWLKNEYQCVASCLIHMGFFEVARNLFSILLLLIEDF